MIILSQSQRNAIEAYILQGTFDNLLGEAERILEQEDNDIEDALSFAKNEKNKLSQKDEWVSFEEMAIVAMILESSKQNAFTF